MILYTIDDYGKICSGEQGATKWSEAGNHCMHMEDYEDSTRSDTHNLNKLQ